jgi:hypothetical protein
MSACRKPNNPFPNMYIAEDGMDSWVGCGRERPGFQPAAPAPPRLSLPPTPQRIGLIQVRSPVLIWSLLWSEPGT